MPNTPLKPHQERVVKRLQEQDGLVVAHGLGSGKTLSSIAAAEALGMPTVALVPASLQNNYKKEIKKHTHGLDNVEVKSLQRAVLRGDMPDQGLVIVDEAHRLRDTNTKSFKEVSKSTAEKRMLLTASPVYNHPSDIAGLVNLAAGQKLLPAGKTDFSAKFVEDKKIDPGFFARTFRGIKPGTVQQLKNTDELGTTLKQWVDFHENSKDGPDFPDRKDSFIHVPMSKKQQEVYDGVLDAAPAWVRYKVQKGLPPSKAESSQLNAFLTAQRQVSNSPVAHDKTLTKEEALPHAVKANEAFKRFLTKYEENKNHRAVVYSNYVETGIEPYTSLLEKRKIPYGVFTGKTKDSERKTLVEDYNNGRISVLLVSSAGGEGLDLKGTRQIQILEPHWNREKVEQVIGRGIRYQSHAHLPESERKVDVEHYLATTRPGVIRGLLKMKPSDKSSDQYLTMLSKDKMRLNDQMKDLMRQSPTTYMGTKTAYDLSYANTFRQFGIKLSSEQLDRSLAPLKEVLKEQPDPPEPDDLVPDQPGEPSEPNLPEPAKLKLESDLDESEPGLLPELPTS